MSKSLVVVAVSVVLTILSIGAAYRSENENHRLKMLLTMSDERAKLQEDQLEDVEFQLKNKPSYEDGYRDAIVRSEGGNFADGYAAAKLVYNSADYSNGYHNAIEQFGYGWLSEDDKATIRRIAASNGANVGPRNNTVTPIQNTSVEK